MMAGRQHKRNASDSIEQQAVSFVCLGVDGPATPELPKTNCPGGLRTQLSFPACWDGKNVDSADHMSHMAYPSNSPDTGFCPPTHPKRFISIFYEVTWSVDDFKDMWHGDRQPFVFSDGDPTGYGYQYVSADTPLLVSSPASLAVKADSRRGQGCCARTCIRAGERVREARSLVCHGGSGARPPIPREEKPTLTRVGSGDFLNGWDVATLQSAITSCTDPGGVIENCGAFQFYSDDEMAGCKVLPRVAEAVDGVLPALPGCNPVQPGPQAAVEAPACGAPTEIGDPQLPFTDVLGALRWRFVGCARDPPGQSRTLDGADEDRADMTVEGCVRFCRGQGFAYAGLENKSQCFCASNAPDPARLPPNGTMGQCESACAGNADQICGGYGWVSVYAKCQQDGCENAKLG